jgi:putative transposase
MPRVAGAPRLRGEDAAAVLSAVGTTRGALPAVTQVDQGAEFTSTALDHWAYWNHVQLSSSRPGIPGDDTHCEAFNGSLRRQALSQHWFASVVEAQHVLEQWWEETLQKYVRHATVLRQDAASKRSGSSHQC